MTMLKVVDTMISKRFLLLGVIGAMTCTHSVCAGSISEAGTSSLSQLQGKQMAPSDEMVDADIPAGKRCGGKPLDRWADLGTRISPTQCKAACLRKSKCAFAVYKVNKKRCTSFASCKSPRGRGFIVWAKQPAESPTPGPTPAPAPVSPTPALPTSPPPPCIPSQAPAAPHTFYVDPAVGNDSTGTGEEARPFATTRKCSLLATNTNAAVHCVLRAGRYTERLELPQVKDLTIEAKECENVIFDGTEVLEDLVWIKDGEVSKAMIEHGAAVRLAKLIVGGASIQCAPGTGGASLFNKFGTCFRWNAEVGWPVLFKRGAAEMFYGTGGGIGVPPSPFWYDVSAKILYVHTASYPGGLPEVRVKVGNTGIYFTKAVQRVRIQNLKFFGATVGTNTNGWSTHTYLQNVGLIGNRFLFHPRNVHIETTKRRGRGAGKYVQLSNNTLEFGEGALFYVGTANLVEWNYLAFNNIEKGGGFLFDSLGLRETFKRNTGLYNGNSGGLRVWSRGYVALDNLFVAPNVGRGWTDTACFHAVTVAQYGLVIRGNWMLGIADTVKSVRFDTSKTTTWSGMGRDGTVNKNVFFGLDTLTIKGDQHRITFNTGDRMNIVTAWALIKHMNAKTNTTWNAVSRVSSRGASTMPGTFTNNVCNGPGCRPLPSSDVCGSLRDCNLNALREGLVTDFSAFDFRAATGSGLEAGAYGVDDNTILTPPGAPLPTTPF